MPCEYNRPFTHKQTNILMYIKIEIFTEVIESFTLKVIDFKNGLTEV